MMNPTVLDNEKPRRFTIKPDSLAQSIILLLGMTAIQRAVGFGRSLLLCRWLPPEELGHWDMTFAFLDMAAPIAVLSIPGCFVRYVEHYRHQGQLKAFIRRTGVATLLLIGGSTGMLYWGRSWFSRLLYGSESNLHLIALVVIALPAIIIFNAINELFSGLRMYRMMNLLQFMQSMLFAVLAISLTSGWHAGASSVVAGYGLTCALCSTVPLYWLVRMWRGLPSPALQPRHMVFWGKLLPFVGSVWMSNLLSHLFLISDRYMILHYSGLSDLEAAAVVGQYHSARVVPLLIVQLSALIGTMFIPYMSHDWESGRRDVVATQLNIFTKTIGLGLTALVALILLASPLLFTGVFVGKFAAGEAILPWTLLCAVWFSMFCITRSYLWCDERVWLVGLSLVTALAVNVGANLTLLPYWGLQGAATAAAMANLALLLVTYGLVLWRGMRIEWGTWFVSAVPASICLGAGAAFAAIVIVIAASLTTNFVFSRAEKEQIISFVRGYFAQWRFGSARWSGNSSHGLELECIPLSSKEPS